jgi:hypothetical protein
VETGEGRLFDSRTPQRVPGYQVAAQELPQNGILLSHAARTRALDVSATGALVWGLCDGQRSVGEIVALLSEAYPSSAGVIPENVVDTLLALTDYGAIAWT